MTELEKSGAESPVPLGAFGRSLRIRVSVSIVTLFGWLSFVLLFLAFWEDTFSGAQTAVVLVVSVLAFVAILGVTWASWGMRYGRTARDRAPGGE